MKKLLLVALAILAIATLLIGCEDKKTEEPVVEPSGEVIEPVVEPVEEPVEGPQVESGEQVGVGNTDEGMVVLVLENHFLTNFGDKVEAVDVKNVRVYSEEEVAANPELFASHNIKEGDIPFEAEYELQLKEGVDGMEFTAGTGEISGDRIINKSNCGIARAGENGYTLDAFGTGF